MRDLLLLLPLVVVAILIGCQTTELDEVPISRPTAALPPHRGDVIVVAGIEIPTGAPVITWRETRGFDASLERCRFVDRVLPRSPSNGCDVPRRFGLRSLDGLGLDGAPPVGAEATLDLATLRRRVDQFVLHYDVCGCARSCFEVLHDVRGLSVHFLLDLDGTIYQTMDLAFRARHATIANDRSVGIEIAQMGASPAATPEALEDHYAHDEHGTRVLLPARFRDRADVLARGDYVPRPARSGRIRGSVHGADYVQYDFTAAQYESLARLTKALCGVLPSIRLDIPRDLAGRLRSEALSRPEFDRYQGVLGHYHVQRNKIDPGPAMDWNWLLARAESLPSPRDLDPRDVVSGPRPGL